MSRARFQVATIVAAVAVLAVGVGLAGYLLAPDQENSVADDGTSAGALITLSSEGWTAEGLAYRVVVLAETEIESVVLMAGDLELDRTEPDGQTVLRVTMHAMSAEPAHATVELKDGRQVDSRTILDGERSPGADTGSAATSGRADDLIPAPIALSPRYREMAEGQGAPALVSANPSVHPAVASPYVQAESGVTWSGPGELRGGVLHIDDPEVSRVFFYITDDGDNWHRVPSAAGTSLPLADGRVNVTGQLPSLAGTDLQLEIWRDDADTTLLGVATASSQSPWDQGSFSGDLGFLGRLDLDLVTGEGDQEQLVKALWLDQEEWSPIDLRWRSDLQNVTHVVWQAFTFRPDLDGTPTDLDAANAGWAKPDNDGRFTFVPPGTTADSGLAVESAETGQSFLNYELIRGQAEPDSVNNDLPQDLKLRLAGIDMSPETPRSWYLRAFAFSGDQWLGLASDVVAVHLGKPPSLKKLPPIGDYQLDLIVWRPSVVDSAWRLCWQVLGIDQQVKQEHLDQLWGTNEWLLVAAEYAYLDAMLAAEGDVLCQDECYRGLDPESYFPGEGMVVELLLNSSFPPGCASGGSSTCTEALGPVPVVSDICDAAVDGGVALLGVAGVGYDLAADAYNGAKEELIDIVAEYSGCNDFAGNEFCKTALTIAADAALASVGLPPSLPSREQLIASAKGDLETALVELAKQQGLGDACRLLEGAKKVKDVTTCEDLAAKIVAEAETVIRDLARSRARQSYGMPFPSGVNVIPDPRGTPDPLQVQVRVLAEPGTQLGPTCEATVVASVTWAPFTLVPGGNAVLNVAAPGYSPENLAWNVKGSPFVSWYESETVQLPKPTSALEPAVVDLLLAPPAGPSNVTAFRWAEGIHSSPGQPTGNLFGFQTWEVPLDVLTLRGGAQLTVVAYASCANGDIVTAILGGASQ